jgi:hypothetical protein
VARDAEIFAKLAYIGKESDNRFLSFLLAIFESCNVLPRILLKLQIHSKHSYPIYR